MNLADILAPGAVKVIGSVSSKKRLFQSLGEMASDIGGLNCSAASAALQDRESLGPTGVGEGVALPHARLETIDHVFGLFVRLETPLDFDSVDKAPVDLVFTLFAPENAGVEHLKALALVSRSMRDANLRNALRSNSDPSVLYTMLTEAQANQAA